MLPVVQIIKEKGIVSDGASFELENQNSKCYLQTVLLALGCWRKSEVNVKELKTCRQ
jgi:hypothetical protein